MRTLVTTTIGLLTLASLTWASTSVSPISSKSQSSVSEPWIAFAEEIKAARDILDAPGTPKDPVTIADAYQWFPRLMRLAWEYAHEYADVRHPALFKSTESYLTNGWQTIDAIYYSAIIDGSKTYRITGTRGTAPLIEFTANERFDAMQGRSDMAGSVTEQTLKVNSEGTFTLMVSPTPQPGNWLKTTPKTNFIFLRQYSHDWSKAQEAKLRIELVDGGEIRSDYQPLATGPRYRTDAPTLAGISASYRTWGKYALSYLRVYHERAVGLLRTHRNDLRAFPHEEGSSMPAGHRLAVGMFDLAEDEVLMIEFSPQEAPYWGLQLGNFWGETLAYDGTARTHLNNQTAQVDTDGRVRIAITRGAQPQGVSNWLSTLGRPVGNLVYRQSRKFDTMPEFHVRVLKL